jgi:L-asparaginase
MTNKKNIVIVFTGGTICMQVDSDTHGVVPSLSGTDILSLVPAIDQIANITIFDFGKYPGPHMIPELMFELSKKVTEFANNPEIHGIVITHGTDTLEETAYFLDLTVRTEKPVIVVGSMMSSSELNWDGPSNLRDAVTIAASDNFKGLGVLTCLSGKINAASEVTKTNTDELDTFQSLNFGVLGTISHGEALLWRKPHYREHIPIKQIHPKVALVKCYAGMEDDLFRYLVNQKYEGIVVEAMGIGNVPPKSFDGIEFAINNNIPVILVSRCPVGRAIDIYGYYGAGKWLRKIGVIYADFLNGQKARIKLIIALGHSKDQKVLREIFEEVKFSV